MELDDITGAIVDSALRIHRDWGPGLMESVYEALLAHELTERGLLVERQKRFQLEYRGVVFDEAFRADLVVNSAVIVEIKSVEKAASVHAKQLLTYLKVADMRVGLLLNFGAPLLKDGLERIVNGLAPSVSPRLRVNQPLRSSPEGNQPLCD